MRRMSHRYSSISMRRWDCHGSKMENWWIPFNEKIREKRTWRVEEWSWRSLLRLADMRPKKWIQLFYISFLCIYILEKTGYEDKKPYFCITWKSGVPRRRHAGRLVRNVRQDQIIAVLAIIYTPLLFQIERLKINVTHFKFPYYAKLLENHGLARIRIKSCSLTNSLEMYMYLVFFSLWSKSSSWECICSSGALRGTDTLKICGLEVGLIAPTLELIKHIRIIRSGYLMPGDSFQTFF